MDLENQVKNPILKPLDENETQNMPTSRYPRRNESITPSRPLPRSYASLPPVNAILATSGDRNSPDPSHHSSSITSPSGQGIVRPLPRKPSFTVSSPSSDPLPSAPPMYTLVARRPLPAPPYSQSSAEEISHAPSLPPLNIDTESPMSLTISSLMSRTATATPPPRPGSSSTSQSIYPSEHLSSTPLSLTPSTHSHDLPTTPECKNSELEDTPPPIPEKDKMVINSLPAALAVVEARKRIAQLRIRFAESSAYDISDKYEMRTQSVISMNRRNAIYEVDDGIDRRLIFYGNPDELAEDSDRSSDLDHLDTKEVDVDACWGFADDTDSNDSVPTNSARCSKKWLWEKGGRRWVEEDYSSILQALRTL